MDALKMTVLFLGVLFLVYAVLPDFFAHRLGIGAWKRHYSAGIALTFDDGPHPIHTPALLAFLTEKKWTVCFFVVVEKALQHPEILLQMKSEGHIIGCHGYHHRHAWLMSPWKTWNQWTKACAELEGLLGEEVPLVRAPWGSVNLMLLVWCKMKKKKLIGWSVMGRDWDVGETPEEIAGRILRKADHGTIALLHDGGGNEGAPENTLRALPLLAQGLKKDVKIPVVPFTGTSWTLGKRLSFRLWEKWEHFYSRKFHVTRISPTNGFRIAKGVYEGADLLGSNGEVLAKAGDPVGELHLENIHFQKMGTDPRKIGLNALRLIRKSMVELAEYAEKEPEYQDVKVFLGRTLLNRGVKGLGFHVEETTHQKKSEIVAFVQQIVYRVYNPGEKKQTGEKKSTPKLVWISRQELLDKHLRSSGEGDI